MSCTFTAGEHEWTLRVTVGVIEEIRGRAFGSDLDTVDLADVTGATMKRLALDDVLLVRILWILIEGQAVAKNVDASNFGESLFGQALEDGYDALKGAVEEFFPPRKRTFFRKMLAEDEANTQRVMEMALAALDDPETRGQMDAAMRKRLKQEIKKSLIQLESVGDLPDSLELMPPTEPSAS